MDHLQIFGPNMTNECTDIERSGWFKLLVPFLAIVTVNLLFRGAGFEVFGPSFFSAHTVIFALCWFALERGYACVIGALMRMQMFSKRT